MPPTTRSQPPVGHVHLVLHTKQPQSPGNQPEDFYLEMPVSFVNEHFLTPLKFLLYLAWCILGTRGNLLDEQRQNLQLDGLLMDRGTYYYGPHETDDVLLYAVDLEVIQLRSTFNSSSSHIRDKAFDEELTQRDGGCIFTGVTSDVQGIHIIPHSKGDWIKLIIANRPNDEVVDDLHSIDDIRNGMICNHIIHLLLEHRDAVVLKTPNAILNVDDVAPRCQRLVEPPPHTSYPLNARYTFQRFESPCIAPHEPDQMLSNFLTPDNNDGAFLTHSPLSNSKPSGLLLNYIYGATAVKRWGRNNSVITDRSIPRPEVKAAAMGPERTPGAVNREKFRKKRKLLETGQEEVGASGSVGGLQDLDVNLDNDDAKREWDEDDIMLFFWGNSKAARERHEKEDQKQKGYIEDWRSTVSAN